MSVLISSQIDKVSELDNNDKIVGAFSIDVSKATGQTFGSDIKMTYVTFYPTPSSVPIVTLSNQYQNTCKTNDT